MSCLSNSQAGRCKGNIELEKRANSLMKLLLSKALIFYFILFILLFTIMSLTLYRLYSTSAFSFKQQIAQQITPKITYIVAYINGCRYDIEFVIF